MKTFLIYLQALISVLLSLVILLQNKGVGLSATFGGSSNVYSSKRSADRMLNTVTIVLLFAFAINALLILVLE
jgi:protein translocase SecG subunit